MMGRQTVDQSQLFYLDAGLVKGEGFAVDASVMEADASRYHGVTPERRIGRHRSARRARS